MFSRKSQVRSSPLRGSLIKMPVLTLGLAIFLLAGTFSNVFAANPPGASAFTTVTSSQAQANWTDGGNVAGTTYYAIISTGASPSTNNFAGNIAIQAGTALDALFTGLQPNTQYFGAVNATDPTDQSVSSFTDLGPFTTHAATPGTSAFSNTTVSQVQANWTANGNPQGTSYTAILSLAASPSTNGLAGNVTVVTPNLSQIFPSLLPNTVYFVDVQAGSSAFASLGSTSTLANAPASGAFSNVQTNQLTANWGANNNPIGTNYFIQLSLNSGFSSIAASNTTSTTTITFATLSAGTTYFARVQAINNAGISTSFTNLGSVVTTSTAPGSLPFSNVSNSQITANWSANGNPAGVVYTAILSTGPSPSTNGLGGNTNATTTNTSAPFTGLAVNTIYYVDVQAAGSGFVSLGSTSTLANLPASANPTNIQTNQFRANWGPNGNPLGQLTLPS